MSFSAILDKYRKASFSQRDKGARFERLMQAYLLTDPVYAGQFEKVWRWMEFPARKDFGGTDTGIDLVTKTFDGKYWAVQCKCVEEGTQIDKPALDTFLSTSGKEFTLANSEKTGFSHRLWLSTTNDWSSNAEETLKNQKIGVSRCNLADLEAAHVDWVKLEEGISGTAARTPVKSIRPHQQEAINKAHAYYQTNDRGKLIMACGTGKTFTALRIVEKETGGSGLVLFLVPSIALLGQMLREWTADVLVPIHPICICSDPEVTKKKTKDEDSDTTSVIDLALPASTNVKTIVDQLTEAPKKGMTVVFSTYQSISVISKAQKALAKEGVRAAEFDLIICDEAHRTTGVTLADEDDSEFVKVHDGKFLAAKKRLYMTATPRLYSDDAKSRAKEADAELCSMDDEKLYGTEIYRIGFGEAVERGLLSDYKVLILTLNESDIPKAVQKIVTDKSNEINTDDASKLIGCINALSKQIIGDGGSLTSADPEPMRRAVAFCQSIKISKKITENFNTVADAYLYSLSDEKKNAMILPTSKHIDGTMSAPTRDGLLTWLKSDGPSTSCRVLTNVRCLSEGVDVPSLDAVMFLSARNSQIDVVQSVGRVMRRAPGKKYGYIIIPIVVPADIPPDEALDDNERYKVVWTVLNALRAHDDRFNATINKIELNKKRPEQILVGRPDHSFNDGEQPTGKTGEGTKLSEKLREQFVQLQSVVFARMVEKVGERKYWEQWAQSVAEIAERQVARIQKLTKEEGVHQKAFTDFLDGLRKNINPSLTEQDAVEMLSQHIITKPVFDALFEGYSFVKHNPISMSMQTMLDLLEAQAVEKDMETLAKFYGSVRKHTLSNIDNAEGKQRIIIELYDKFFKTAFPKMAERLGIVYTPVEVVDFIIHSVNDILREEFGRTLSDENIHILDPFTGTGTFITRLLQSGLIGKDDLPRKYAQELHANEIVLLAYYIAAVNIENAYHDIMDAREYAPFDGICLTDTFQIGESSTGEGLFSKMFPQNSERVLAQMKVPVRVIIGNPPYSIGQGSQNDNNQNLSYPKLDSRIEDTYAAKTNAVTSKGLYDSYIRAIRWASDRIGETGIISFVTNAGFIDANTADGLRKCLAEEFSKIHIFHLRGNARTQGEQRRKEKDNVFGVGSRAPIAISFFVKNPAKQGNAFIQFHDIGDYLSREQKLDKLKEYRSTSGITAAGGWNIIVPDEHGDWFNQRDASFDKYIILGDKSSDGTKLFENFSLGVGTNRDAWCYNLSREIVLSNMGRMINFYNSEVDRFSKTFGKHDRKTREKSVDNFIDKNPTNISWSSSLIPDLISLNKGTFDKTKLIVSMYRPFIKQWLYYDNMFNHRVGQMLQLFPDSNADNLVIQINANYKNDGHISFISNALPDLHCNGDSQCFPRYLYDEPEDGENELFTTAKKTNGRTRRDAFTKEGLEHFRTAYPRETITPDDIFYYIYGILHSPDYREKYADNLTKELPRIPCVKAIKDFRAFSEAGRKLADLHINYEDVPPYKGVSVTGADGEAGKKGAYEHYAVEKMRYAERGKKDTIQYNSRITISNIPNKAFEYVVNGKSAVDWVIDRYQVDVHKESGIKNDPNDWAREHKKPRYILDLLLSVINVSVQTVDIVAGLPKMEFDETLNKNGKVE